MPKQNTKNIHSIIRSRLRLVGYSLVLFTLIGGATVTQVNADQFDEQINALNQQNNATQGAVNSLTSEANSFQAAIDVLQQQINGLQAQLNGNIARQTETQAKIVAAQKKIDENRVFLKTSIKDMYVDGQMSTVEELATSKNLSEYVDKEEYRNVVQSKIDLVIKDIAAQQATLQQQKAELDTLITTQRQQTNELASAQSKQQEMLAYNQSQRDSYNGQIAANSNKIKQLRQQQIAANARFIGGGVAGTGATCGGGYPAKWCEIPMDSVLDSWGMYNRECVSYTAFRVAASGRYMPGWGWSARGNANQWDDNARAAGIPVDSNPRAGDIAVSNSGYYGHVMYVESVNPNGTINISQYNASLDGRYSTRSGMNPGGLVFIHF